MTSKTVINMRRFVVLVGIGILIGFGIHNSEAPAQLKSVDQVVSYPIPAAPAPPQKVKESFDFAPQLSKLSVYVHNLIAYNYDEGKVYQTPQETLSYGSGQCRDYVTLMMWLAHKRYDINPVFDVIYVEGQPHAVMEYMGNYYDPTLLAGYTKETIPQTVWSLGYYDMLKYVVKSPTE